MKKSFLALASFAAIAVGCQVEKMTDELPLVDENLVVKAVTEAYAPATKTAMDGLNVVWSEDDAIAVFAGQNLPDKYVVSEGVGETSAEFTLEVENPEYWGETTFNVAYYPYDPDAFLQDMYDNLPYIALKLPNVQPYVEGNFAKGVFPMAAVTTSVDDMEFSFKNVLGLMKLQLKGTKTVKSISVAGGASEYLAGQALVSFEEGLPKVMIADYPTYTSVSVDCGDGVTLKADEVTEFYVALPPTEFESGFAVTVFDTDNKQYTIKAAASEKNVIERSKILVMPEVNVDEIVSPVDFSAVPSLTDAELQITLNDPNVKGFYGIFAMSEEWSYASSYFTNPEYFELLVNCQVPSEFGLMIPGTYYEGSTYEGNLSEFGWSPDLLSTGAKNMVAPGSASTVIVIPVIEGKDSYSLNDAIISEVYTSDLTVGGTVALPEYEVVSTYTKFAVEFAPSNNVAYAIYGFFGPEDELPTEENCLETMWLNPIFNPDGSFTLEDQINYGEQPGAVYKLSILLVGNDGSAQLHFIDVPTKELLYDESLTVSVEVDEYDTVEQKVYAYVTEWPENAVELLYAINNSASYNTDYALATAIDNGYFSKIDLTTVEDDEIELSVSVKPNSYSIQKRYAHVLVKTDDGKVSKLVTSDVVEIHPVTEN